MPNRISALIDSEQATGLYQSDDRGATWTLVSEDANITVRPFYFFHLYASPADGDELWVLTNKLWQSLDGGATWLQRSGTSTSSRRNTTVPSGLRISELLALDEALTAFAEQFPDKAQLVKLRYFAGFTIDEAAEILGISSRKANDVWTYARTWLFTEIGQS